MSNQPSNERWWSRLRNGVLDRLARLRVAVSDQRQTCGPWLTRMVALLALLLWWQGAERLFDLHRPLAPGLLLGCFSTGFVASVALVVWARRIDLRWFGLLLAVAHGLCGLLVDVALST